MVDVIIMKYKNISSLYRAVNADIFMKCATAGVTINADELVTD